MNEPRLYSINPDAHNRLWHILFLVMVLGGLSIVALLVIIRGLVFETTMGSSFISVAAIAWGSLVINYQKKIADGFKVEVDDSGLVLTVPNRRLVFPREGFLKAEEHSNGLRLYHRNKQPLYIPKTLTDYDLFKHTVQSWMPYKRLDRVSELRNSVVLVVGLFFTFALFFLAAERSVVSEMMIASGVTVVVFVLASHLLLQIVYDATLQRRLHRIIWLFLGIVMLVMSWQLYISG